MTTRSIIRAADWHLGIDREDGAPTQPITEAECTTCGETSGAREGTRLPVELWALKHTGQRPDHRSFRAIQTTFWRVTPAPGNPYAEPTA